MAITIMAQGLGGQVSLLQHFFLVNTRLVQNTIDFLLPSLLRSLALLFLSLFYSACYLGECVHASSSMCVCVDRLKIVQPLALFPPASLFRLFFSHFPGVVE